MKRRIPAPRACAILAVALAGLPTNAADLKFPVDRPIDMLHIRLDIRVDLEARSLAGSATLEMRALRRVERIQLDAVDMDVAAVDYRVSDGAWSAGRFEHDGAILTLLPPGPLPAGRRIDARITYSTTDPPAGLHFFGPTEDEPDAPYILWTQGEAISNRYWVPCFDHPNEKQSTEIVCRVDAPNMALSNGRLVQRDEHRDGTRTFHWLQDKPHAAYLMTLVVGEFVSKETSWRGRPVIYYARARFADWMDNSFAHTTKMMDFFSDRIGIAYPWDQYAQVCCYAFGGGMENTSATTLTEATLHDDRAHLDRDSDGLVAHELAHQWWGDLVTCNDWAHIWLNEGFATYFEALWAEHHLGADEFAVNMHGKARRVIGADDKRPIVWREFESPDEQFDSRAYPKGAWVLHMLRRRLGDDVFWKVVHAYAERFSHRSAETSDFRRVAEEVTGRSLGRFFHDWTEQPGVPKLRIAFEWIAEEQAAAISVAQVQEESEFEFPLTIEFQFDGDAQPLAFTRTVRGQNEEWSWTLDERPALVRLDPDNAVLADVAVEQPRDLWVAQLHRDANPVARIRAAEHFADTASEADVELLAARLPDEPFWAVQAVIAESLGKQGDDTAREALIKGLSLPNPKARSAVAEALGKFDEDEQIAAALMGLIETGDPSYRVEAAAMTAYAAVSGDEPFDALLQWMDRDSCNEIIRRALLRAMGDACGPEALSTLIEWSAPGRPLPCRQACVTAIAAILEQADDADRDLQETAVETLIACANSGQRRLQSRAIGALARIGRLAQPALPTLQRLETTGLPRVRAAAARAIKSIRKATMTDSDADKLIEQIADLEDMCRDLRERLTKLESRSDTAQFHEGHTN